MSMLKLLTLLYYNLILGRSWFYAMTVIVLHVLNVLLFPHEGNIETIDQLDYCVPLTQISTMGNSIPLVVDNAGQYQIVGMNLFKTSSLIGLFPQLPPPDIPSTSSKALMHMISLDPCGPHRTLDPWVMSPNLMEFDQVIAHPSPSLVE